MNEDQTLLDSLSKLKNAVEQEDWSSAEKMNNVIRAGIQQAVLDAQNDDEKKTLIELLKNIQALFHLLISNTEESRSKISVELKKISADKKAANLYLKSSQYR